MLTVSLGHRLRLTSASDVCAVRKLRVCCRNPDTLKKLNETEKALKQRKEQEYINVDLSNEEREKGNQACPSDYLNLPFIDTGHQQCKEM